MSHAEAPYSMTFKTSKGNLFTVRGNTSEELATNLALASVPVATDDGPTSVLDMIREIESSLTGATAGGSQPGNVVQFPQQGQGSLAPPCPTCGGGTSHKSGTGSKGPWGGWFCNTGDKSHKAKWD